MARFLPVLLAAVALLAAGPSTAEGFWRGVLKSAVLPDAILRRLHAETTSTVSEGMGGGTGRSTSGLDYDDYTRLPPAAARKEEAAPFGYDYRAAPSEGGARARWGSEARDGDDVPFNYGYKEPISELGGTEGGSVTSARSGDGGTAKGTTGRSTSGLDYDDYTRLPPAARKEEYEYYYKAAPIPSEGGGAARNDDDVPFNYDYKEPSSELGGTDGGEATSESGAGNKETVGPPFNYSYKGPSEATSESEEAGNKETVGPPFNYSYKATAPEERRGGQKEEEATTTTTTVFFHEESVRVGARLRFRFPAATPAPLGLLPRRAADSVPFSTEALPHILALLRVPPGSVQAAAMAETLRICEWPPLAGESKFCAASLEALVERAMAALGTRDVRAVTSALPRAGASVQTYAVRAVRRVVDGGAGFFVACHDEAYPYTVYRCHTTGPARAYLMEMEGAASGIKITVATVCHTDTSQWDPEHLSFKLLGTRPGGEPICHLMPYGHIIWAKNVNRSPA